MSYITSFDHVFVSLCAFYAACISLEFLVSRKFSAGSGLAVAIEKIMHLRQFEHVIVGMWLGVLGIAAYYSMKGFTTFMLCFVVLFVVMEVRWRIINRRRLQQCLSDETNKHMVDLSGHTGL